MINMSASVSGRKYRGRTALNYEKNRTGQRRWRLEHEAVRDWLPAGNATVLDVPCGTGRFFGLYAERGLRVTALDISDEMLALAKRALPRNARERVRLGQGDVFKLPLERYDTVICVRLLHLVSAVEMHEVLREICRAAQRQIILTVRLASKYNVNSSSTTQCESAFWRAVKLNGWKLAEERVLSHAGWRIVRLEKRA